MSVPADYFDAAMAKLRDKFLNVPLDAVLHPASLAARQAATEKRSAAKAPTVAEDELTAQQWFERGFNATDPDEKIRFYTEAIRLKPDYRRRLLQPGPCALQQRRPRRRARRTTAKPSASSPTMPMPLATGAMRATIKAIWTAHSQDYNQAIRLKPDFADAFYNRGIARYMKGDLDGALAGLRRGHPPQARLRRSVLQPGPRALQQRRLGRRTRRITTRPSALSPTTPCLWQPGPRALRQRRLGRRARRLRPRHPPQA